MKTLSRFVIKFTNLIAAVLSCFDRVIFSRLSAPSPTGRPSKASSIASAKIRRCDFMASSPRRRSKVLVDFAKRMAQEAGAEYRFLQGHHRKDKLIGRDAATAAYLCWG